MPAGRADPRIDRYLAKDRPWRDEIAALRAILLSEGLDEALKWRKPCYAVPGGGNVAIIAPFRDCCGLSFFKGVLLDDRSGLLVPPGDASRSAMLAKFTDLAGIAAAEAALRALIRRAADNERAGRKVVFARDDLNYPAELTEALAADPALRAAFEALTPGRRRGYLLQISGARQPATRRARIVRWTPRILAGKGMHDR